MSDTAWDDAERLRRRQSQLDDDRTLNAGLQSFAACVAAQVVSSSTSAQVYYTMAPVTVSGPEVEGGPATITPGPGRFKAFNLGSVVPPTGINVICSRVNYRWAFRYDG